MSDKATLKAFFETGDVPTEEQFADLIDSNINTDDTDPQTVAGDVEFEGDLTGPTFTTIDGRVTNLEDNQNTSAEAYETFEDESTGQSFLPVAGEDKVLYRVTNDPDPAKNAYYTWNGSSYVEADTTDQDAAIELNTAGRQVTSALAANKDYIEAYDGISSYAILAKSYDISAVGDFIEIVFKQLPNSGLSAYGAYGEIGTLPNRIAFTGTTLFVYDVNNTQHLKTGFGDTSSAYTRVRLEVGAGGLEAYLEGHLRTTFATFAGLVVDGIGNCNEDNFTALEHVSIEISSTADGYLKETVSSANIENESKSVSISDYGRLILKNTSVLKTINDTGSYLTDLDNLYSAYDGVDSVTTLDDEYILDAEGDYIEITARANAFPAYGLVGMSNGGSNQIGFNDSNDLWISESNGTWVFFNSVPADFSVFQKIKVEVIAGPLWQLSIGDTIITTKTKSDSVKIRSFGNAYTTNANVDIKGVTISSVSGNFETANLYYTDAINESVTLLRDTSVAETSAELSNCYVSYDPTGGVDSLEKFTIYSRIGETSYYVAYVIDHELDTDPIIYIDIYRLTGATLYQWVDGVFISTGLVVLVGGEQEFTYSRDGKSDFTGGSHGDELYVTINFYIDNTRLTSSELASSFDLKECDNFRYEQRSTLHETSDDGINPIPGHPLEADHDKITWFKDGKRITHNKITWQAVLTDIYHCYIAQNGFHADVAEYGTIKNDCGVTAFTTSSGNVLTGVHDGVTIWNETNNIGAELSTFVKPESVALNRHQFVWDTVYAKHYMDTSWLGIYNNTVAIGEIWDGEIEVEFKKKLS